MGQSKLELAVGTGQWDAGLRKAQQSLNAFTQAQGGLQQALNKDNGDMQKFIQMMSKMDSTANTAKGQMNDYKRVLEQLTADYNRMSDAQKNSIGQDYLQTIDALKQKFQAAKQQVEDFNNSLNDLGDVKLPEIKGGGSMFGGLTDMLSVAGGNLLASGIQKLGSEIMDTVQQGIELARAGEGVRLAFERLNQPGLLDNLKEATHGTVSELELMKAAVKFDDFNLPVEQLGTLLAFAQKKAKDTGQSVDYMVDSIVTGLGRKSLMILDNLGLSAAQIKDRMKESGDMTVAVADIIKEQMAEAGEYVETAADRAARAAADAANEMEKLGMKAGPVAEEWGRTWNEIKFAGLDLLNTVLTPIADSLRDIREILSGEYTLKIKTEFDNPLGPNVDDNGNYIKKPGSGNWAGFNANNGTWNSGYYGAIYNSSTGKMEFPDFVVNGTNRKKTKPTKSGGSTNTNAFVNELTPNSIADYTKQIQELRKLQNDVSTTEGWQGLQDEITHLNVLIKELKGELKVEPYSFSKDAQKMGADFDKQMRDKLSNPDKIIGPGLSKIVKEIAQPTKKEANLTQEFSKMSGGIQSIVGGIESLGVEIPQGMKDIMNGINGVMSILTGISALVTAIQAITAADAIIPFANGGIVRAANGYVGGNNYSGDMVPAMLNSGELILNRAQQGVIAGALEGTNGSVHVTGEIQGEKIVLAANRYLKRSGQGELVTWR